MRAIIIATFCKIDSYGKEKVVGYRLLRLPDKESDTKWTVEISDVSEYQLQAVMKNKQLSVINATIKNGAVHGINGQMSRYAKIDANTKQLISKSPLIIIKQIKGDNETIGYMVSDYKGQIVKASLSDTINYARINGIANGKVVQSNGKATISAIYGDYSVLNVEKTENKVKPVKAEENSFEFKKLTIDEFKEQMDKAGLVYKLNGGELSCIDDRVRTLVIPEGITCVGNLKQTTDAGGGKVSNIETIHIPKSVWSFNYNWSVGLNNLKKIIIDPEMEVLALDEFRECGLDKIHKLPDNLEILRWHAYNTEDNKDILNDFSEFKKLKRLEYSYNGSKIVEPVNLGNVSELYSCFCNGESELPLKVDSNILQIQACFSNGTYPEVDFSEATGLSRLDSNALHHVKGIKRIDLSKCINITHIDYNCLRALPDLEELILPPNLEHIADGCLNELPKLTHLELPQSIVGISQSALIDTGITEIEIPAGLEYASFRSDALVLKPQNKDYIQSRVYNDGWVKRIELNDTIKEFKRGCFMRTHAEINIPSALEKIHYCAFMGFRGTDVLDFSECSKLRFVDEGAFQDSEAKVIVLSDAVEYIGDTAFKNVKYLKWIYIPKSATKLGKSIFRGTGMHSPSRFTVYTQKDSVIDKYCKKNSIKVEYVESAEEALMVNGETAVDERKLKKYNLLLSGNPQHSILFQEPYVAKIDELYKMFTAVTNRVNWSDRDEVKLNTTKFTSVPLKNIMKAEDIEFYTGLEGAYKNKNAFNSMVNYITAISESYNGLLTKEAFDYMRKNNYINEENEEMLCKVAYNGETWCIAEIPGIVDKERFQLIVVTKGENIIYCTACNKYYECTIAKPINKEICKYEEVSNPVDTVLKIGDTYRYKHGNANIEIPAYIERELLKAFEEQTILIGAKVIKSNAFGYGDGSAQVYLLSCLSQKIIKTEARCYDIDPNESMSARQVKNITIVGVYDWDTLPEEDLKMIKESYFNNKKLGPIMQKIVYGDNYIDKIKNAKGAYDKPSASYEWELSKALIEAGVTGLDRLNVQGINLILDTPFFVKTRKKITDLNKLTVSKKYELEGGDYTLITYIYSSKRRGTSTKLLGYEYKYISTIKDNRLGRDISTVECFIHNHHIEAAFKKIYSIYNPKATKEYIVDNNEINLKDYEIIGKIKKYIATYSCDELSYDIALAINKSTGIVYLIGGNYRSLFKPDEYSKVYKLFRFRNLSEAVEGTSWMYTDNCEIEYNNTKYDLDDAICYLVHELCDGDTGRNKDDRLYKARELVMQGYPNGYTAGDLTGAIFSLVAKQPSGS